MTDNSSFPLHINKKKITCFDQVNLKLGFIFSNSSETDILLEITKTLFNSIPYYDWVGFYFANHASQSLLLGPFSGPPTEHTKIPFGKGICGQVAESNSLLNVVDVSKEQNYIACSLTVKSELVVPIFIDNKNIGQIDIDSNTANAFSHHDETFITALSSRLSSYLKDHDSLYLKYTT